jgi:hypothetical protein
VIKNSNRSNLQLDEVDGIMERKFKIQFQNLAAAAKNATIHLYRVYQKKVDNFDFTFFTITMHELLLACVKGIGAKK